MSVTNNSAPPYIHAGPLRDAAAVDKAVEGLNTDQAEAVRHVLRAEDYALLLGMPGTGKTHTVVKLVAALVEAGQSVLLTAFTNNAVDNLLLKLARLEPPVPFVRLGRLRRGPSVILPPPFSFI